MSSHALLIAQLRTTNMQLDKQINAIQEEYRDSIVSVYSLKYKDGKYVMGELLSAKAQVLNAIAILESTKK